MAERYTLGYRRETKKEPEESVTTRDDEVTTKVEQKQSAFLNPNGTPNQAVNDYFQKNYVAPLQQAHGIDPETGQVKDATIYTVLGIDPQKSREQRELEAKRNRQKQISAALYHSGALLSDMLSASLGGNVWKRDKDTTAKEAAARNLQLQAEQRAEDAAVGQARNKLNSDYLAALQKMRDAFDKSYSTVVSTSTKSGGGSKTTKKGGNSLTTGYNQTVVKDGKNDSGGGKDKWIMNINTKNADGTIKKNGYELNQNEFNAVANLLISHYNRILNQKDENGNLTAHAKDLRKKLLDAHVLKKTAEEDLLTNVNIQQNDYNTNQVLQNGTFWDLDNALRERIERVSGNKIKFTHTDDDGWGDVYDD